MKQEKEQEKAPQEEQRQEAAPPAGEEPQAAASPEKEAASQDREALEKLQKEFDQHKQQYLRVLAEYDNFRKRTAHEKDAIYNNAVSDTVQAILPIADNIERALSQENASAEDMKKGVEMIEAQIKSAFEKLGVTEVGQAGAQWLSMRCGFPSSCPTCFPYFLRQMHLQKIPWQLQALP